MNARRYLILAAAAIAIAVAASSVAAAGERAAKHPSSPASTGPDAVLDWNQYALDAIVTTAGQNAVVAALSFAMVQGAVYDAVNAIDGTHEPYLAAPPASPSDSKKAAVATAAFTVLAALFPAQLPTLQPLYDAYLAAIPAGDPKTGGIAVGGAAAAAMLAARQNDGRFGTAPTVPPPAPGIWRPTPPFNAPDPIAWLANVRPFLVPNVEMLRSDGPNPLTSDAYAKDFNEVKEFGSLTSTTRTPEQTAIAIFWQGSSLLASWNGALRGLSTSQGLDTAERARLFAMTYLAAADGYIGCWNDKYHWTFWRPITAIREADTDGNPATEADANWTPLFDPATPVISPPPLATPPFPDHPSAHSCASSAIVNTLQTFFGTDKIPFTISSSKSLTPRTLDRFSDALKEVIDARVWGGIHFRTADVQGAVLGKKVAHWLRNHYFQPTEG
jgi:hypothetical protein